MKKKILKSIGLVLGVLVLIIVGYVIHVFTSYYRIENKINIEVENTALLEVVDVTNEYTISTYNVGFGAHSQNFTFFMDSGETQDGVATQGKWSKARSKEEVLFNTNGGVV